MMPIGIERCGFLASSPVERQKAASVPAPWYSTGQLAPEDEPQQGLSMAAWGWAAAGRGCQRGRVPRRAAALAVFGTAKSRSAWLQPQLPGMQLPGSWARSLSGRASPLPPPAAPAPCTAR